VFFPAFNDAPTIGALIDDAFAVLNCYAADHEVIVINDGSRDTTAEVLGAMVKKYTPRMRVVTHATNRGYGAALSSGFAAATKELVFYTDGDGQYDVKELPKLLDRMSSEVGLVNGYKLERNDPQHRIWIGHVYNTFARFLFRIRIRDVDCDFRLIRRRLLAEVNLVSTSGAICVELVRKLELTGFRVEEVGVHHYPRLHGRSQFFRARSLLKTLHHLLQLYMQLVLIGRVQRAQRALGWTSQ
jgi:glycosyltransferase involved in cell wall biosynthesis